MNRRTLLSALLIAVVGCASLWVMKRPSLMIGWLLGIAIGIVNFSFLLSSVRKQQASSAGGKSPTGKFQKSFFARYVLLAGAFFLIIQLGRDQLGSSVMGFLSLYVALFVDYLFRAKQKTNLS